MHTGCGLCMADSDGNDKLFLVVAYDNACGMVRFMMNQARQRQGATASAWNKVAGSALHCGSVTFMLPQSLQRQII